MHPIDFSMLRRLVPHYHDRDGNDYATRQSTNLLMLSVYLDPKLTSFGIDTLIRKAYFLGQACVESNDFCDVVEDHPRGYEGREDLGNVYPGDGQRFIGRGVIQLTGRTNYAKATESLTRWHVTHDLPISDTSTSPMCLGSPDLESNPDAAASFPLAIETACAFWIRNGLNQFADADDAFTLTGRINVGLNKFSERLAYTRKAKSLLNELSNREVEQAFEFMSDLR